MTVFLMSHSRAFIVVLLLSSLLVILPTPAWEGVPVQSAGELIHALGAAKSGEERTALLTGHSDLVDPAFLESLLAEADRLKSEGEYDGALSEYLSAAEAAQILSEPRFRARALNGIGETHRLRSEFPAAESALEEALALSQQNQDNDGMAEANANMGRVLYLQGNYTSSEEHLRTSLDLSRSTGNQKATAASLNVLGLVLDAQGEIPEALVAFRESVRLYEEADNKNATAGPMSNMARLLAFQGDYEASMDCLKKALAVFEATGQKPNIASILVNMGNLYADRGDYRQSLLSTERALEIYRAVGDQFGVADSLNNIGETYQVQGNLDLAREFYQKAMDQYKAVGAEARVAVTLANIGNVYALQNKTDLARKFLDASLKIRRNIGDMEGVATVLSAIANNDSELKNYAAAFQTYQESLKISEGLNDVKTLSQTNILMARTYFRMGQYSSAVDAAGQALAFARKIPDEELIWQSQAIAGDSYLAQRNFISARESLEKSIATIESLREKIVGGEEQTQLFFETRTAPYYSMTKLLLMQNQQEQALSFAERAKARVMLEAIQNGRIPVTKSMTAAEQQKEKQLSGKLVVLNKLILMERQSEQPDPARLAKLSSALDHDRLEFEAFQTSLYAAHPELKVQRGVLPGFLLSDAPGLLTDDSSAILEFMVGQEETYLFVITGKDKPALMVHSIPVKGKNIAGLVDRFRQQMASRDPLFRKSAAAAFDTLLGPARNQLKGKTALIIIPDSDLWQLPFQALVSAPNRYLIDDCSVSYAPSLAVLHEMKTLRGRRPENQAGALLAFGNPSLGNNSTRSRADRELWDPLPQAEKEVIAIGELYASEPSKIYIGAEAREGRVKSEANSFRILHMATHGMFDDSSPMYSHLVLSQLNGNSTEDGLLEAWEIMKMDLQLSLVVLSACETARGRYGAGEGMIGLTWAFFVAGCPATVVSQWKVESASTARLMLAFHKNLRVNGLSPAAALRQAELALRHSEDFSHPFYWAPFVLVGAGS